MRLRPPPAAAGRRAEQRGAALAGGDVAGLRGIEAAAFALERALRQRRPIQQAPVELRQQRLRTTDARPPVGSALVSASTAPSGVPAAMRTPGWPNCAEVRGEFGRCGDQSAARQEFARRQAAIAQGRDTACVAIVEQHAEFVSRASTAAGAAPASSRRRAGPYRRRVGARRPARGAPRPAPDGRARASRCGGRVRRRCSRRTRTAVRAARPAWCRRSRCDRRWRPDRAPRCRWHRAPAGPPARPPADRGSVRTSR